PKKTPRFSAAARARLAATFPSGAKIERRADRTSPWPLTGGQERLWLAEELLGPTPLYHVPLAVHLVGALDVCALEQALGALLSRHELLRGRFARTGEQLTQTITDGLGFRLARHALQGGTPAANYAHALELARAEFRRPIELARELPLRAALWSLGPDEHLLLLTVHHLVCDGITIGVLCDELAEHYAAERSGRPLSLIEPEFQHGDYALWQRAESTSEAVRTAVAHVAARLADAPAPLDLPGDHPRPARWTVRGGWTTRRLGGALVASLEGLARDHGATPFQLFLAAAKALLYRWTRQEDLVVGVPATLRDQAELERLPGFLVNTLPIRTRVEGTLSFVELLARVRDSALDAFGHKEAPFERVLEVLRPARDPARTPLFQVMFDHRASLAHGLQLEGLTSGRLLGEDELHSGTAKVDLALYTELVGGELVLAAEYRSDLFEQATIARLLERLEVLLRGVAAHPHARVDELPWLGAEERELVLETWARGPRVDGCERSIPAAFAAVAARLGTKVALEHGDERMTYAELLGRARRLARRLLELGVERGEPVALCVARTSALVVAELAILEAGGAYLPLDPNYPAERLRFMLADSGARVLVSEGALAAQLPHENLCVLDLDVEGAALAAGPLPPPLERAGPGDPAYLIYTSGSTGVPKGVACPHRGVLRLFQGARWLSFDERVRMVHLAPESFDASILDIFGPLLGGGTLVLHPEKTPTLAGLARVVAEHRIDTLFLTTALFHALVDEAPETLARLRQIATGGEALSFAHLERARRRAPELAIANCYGPTEATVIATTWSVPLPLANGLTLAPIGTPLANTDVLVLDERGEPVPIGVAGELHVGGNSIALGYWKRPELTAERFVPDPRGAGRLYRTGDLARWRTDGTLEFLGRRDDQVKIRGHRIELSEIESRLAEHPGVRRALVIAARGPDGAQRLLAYAVPGATRPSSAELAAHLAARLPEYMRPSACVLLDELPVTPGGKIDRARLPEPTPETAGGLRTPPLGPSEERLAALWRELLDVPEVAREDDFFALGGHSLSATILSARVAKQLGVELPLATLFEARTLAELARALERAQPRVPSAPLPPRPRDAAHGPLSSNQRGLWFLQELAPKNAFYNVPFALPLLGPLDAPALARALEELQRRHEALRSVYPLVDGVPVARVATALADLVTLDLAPLAPGARATRKAEILAEFAARPFELAHGPLFRTLLVREEAERATLAVCVHHIAFDGWSFDVFFAELAALYDAAVRGAPAQLPAPAAPYADHAWRQQHELTSERHAAELAFWKQELAGAPLVLELPTDRARPATPS
ncbi:MAG: amino acid adenylation domain-containing protein, partial [Planctomycetota bacterium]